MLCVGGNKYAYSKKKKKKRQIFEKKKAFEIKKSPEQGSQLEKDFLNLLFKTNLFGIQLQFIKYI